MSRNPKKKFSPRRFDEYVGSSKTARDFTNTGNATLEVSSSVELAKDVSVAYVDVPTECIDIDYYTGQNLNVKPSLSNARKLNIGDLC